MPRPLVEFSTSTLLEHAAPLFEEEGHARADALIPNLADPWAVHQNLLSANNDPVGIVQI